MDITESVTVGADADELYALVSDLSVYPEWLGLVVRAEPEVGAEADPRGSWTVELRGRVGPFARSKRLRMVRTDSDPPRSVAFERAETDGREHADWRLSATITQAGSESTLTMSLHYGGTRFAPVLAPLLRDEIRHGRQIIHQRYPSE